MRVRLSGSVSRRAILGLCAFALLCSPALANDFTLSIQSPTNNPLWFSGTSGSVTWTWTGGPLPTSFNHWKVRIVDSTSPSVEFLNISGGTSTSPPVSQNFTVPTVGSAGSKTIRNCTIIVEGYDSSNPTPIITTSTSVQIETL